MRRFAYADPPYLGCAVRYYGTRHPEAASFDGIEAHRDLVGRLVDEFPDGWALSCHVPSLRSILELCPRDVRVAAWVKPFSGVRPGIRARFSWEPVLYRTRLAWDYGQQFTDHLVANGNRREEGVELFPGRKPEAFSAWIVRMLGAGPDDEVVDLFAGSGDCLRAFSKRRDPAAFQLELGAA